MCHPEDVVSFQKLYHSTFVVPPGNIYGPPAGGPAEALRLDWHKRPSHALATEVFLLRGMDEARAKSCDSEPAPKAEPCKCACLLRTLTVTPPFRVEKERSHLLASFPKWGAHR